MPMHAIRIDRSRPLADDPHVGHNRYHPDIEPVAEIGEGEEIALETRHDRRRPRRDRVGGRAPADRPGFR
jgi:hypothetical protein